MWEGLIGSLIGAGAKLIPGLFGDGSDRKSEAQFNANYELQQRMAEHGTLIRARDVMDAYRETGIHPLSLLGVNPASASPVGMVGGSSGGNWRKGIADAGQDIGRAVSATADQGTRNALAKLSLERGGLENELLRVQIANQVQNLERGTAQVGPAMPGTTNKWLVDGQGDTNTELRSPVARGPLIVDKPLEREASDPGRAHQTPGAIPSLQWSKTSDGGYTPVMSKDYKERTEDQFLPGLKHFYSNTIVPMFNPSARRAPFDAPDGHHWYVDYKGDWYLRRNAPVRLKGAGWRD